MESYAPFIVLGILSVIVAVLLLANRRQEIDERYKQAERTAERTAEEAREANARMMARTAEVRARAQVSRITPLTFRSRTGHVYELSQYSDVKPWLWLEFIDLGLDEPGDIVNPDAFPALLQRLERHINATQQSPDADVEYLQPPATPTDFRDNDFGAAHTETGASGASQAVTEPTNPRDNDIGGGSGGGDCGGEHF